jgi:hypothetical protein
MKGSGPGSTEAPLIAMSARYVYNIALIRLAVNGYLMALPPIRAM